MPVRSRKDALPSSLAGGRSGCVVAWWCSLSGAGVDILSHSGWQDNDQLGDMQHNMDEEGNPRQLSCWAKNKGVWVYGWVSRFQFVEVNLQRSSRLFKALQGSSKALTCV
jgi:hypothetical protein